MRKPTAPLLLLCCTLLLGCEETKLRQASRAAQFTTPPAETLSPGDAEILPHITPIFETFAKFQLPSAEFKSGEVSPCEPDSISVESTKDGFVVKMPSASPIPTPTVIEGHLFASGGFSSKEYYCLNASTGKFVWGAQLSDDGPSMAATADDSIIINTESCTIFALDRKTGKCLWSHYMGDPMMGAPAVRGGRVFTVYPAQPNIPAQDNAKPEENIGGHQGIQAATPPTYVLACLNTRSGEVLWRHWLDGDCVSAPVPTGDEVLVATLPGTLYRFDAKDGGLVAAWNARTTSMPVLAKGGLFFTRRTDETGAQTGPHEAVVRFDMNKSTIGLLAANKPAPYLNRAIQEASESTKAANSFEKSNGIGGGFGGGFFAVDDTTQPAANEGIEKDSPKLPMLMDALGQQQQKAADNLGLGNVSTLQSYHGSQILNVGDRNVNCMGDEVVCTSVSTGKTIWSVKLAGDLEKSGGHLGAPPVFAEGDLFISTVGGKVLRMRLIDGSVRSEYEIGSELRFSPVVDGGRLYVSTQNGRVVCLKLRESAAE